MTYATEFRLRRPAQTDLVFSGELIANESSREDESQPRWTEIRIYRTTSGKYVTEDIGCSVIQGERALIRVSVCETPQEVREALTRHQDGRVFLRDIALDAIDAASQAHPELSQAREEHI